MANDNVGSWFAVGTVGSIVAGAGAGVVPLVAGDWGGQVPQIVTALTILSVIFAFVALIAFAGFMNLVVRYLGDLAERRDY
ncbi:hypothetical protein [Citricoccus sp. GCM10030269]|uniref:hypothetical protein n=1 Tax=Citricoccus sp. GCM10030269 TaxID=3273388 RepID=UPI003611C952